MIHYVDGSVLSHKGIITHQVNCKGVMGAGLALQIRKKYPRVFESYKRVASVSALGRAQLVSVEPGVYVANVFGQNTYGRYGVHTDYKALKSSFLELAQKSKDIGASIGIPYGIGCGLAGGDWSIVSSLIEETLSDCDVTIYKFS